MCRRISIIFLITSIFFIPSCKDVLEAPTQSSLDEQMIFTTPVLAEGAYTGIVRSFMETNAHNGRYLLYYGTNTDVELDNASMKTYDSPEATLCNYQTSPTNTLMNTSSNVWASMYGGIERANLAIRAIHKYNNLTVNKEMAQLLGEILTIRAVMYLELIKGWGDVPARFDPITAETTNLPRSSKDIIYKQLLADLAEAADYLPWPNESVKTRSVERVSKSFAKGLRARVALYAAGYSQWADGTIHVSTDPDLTRQKMYAIAKNECLDIINQKSQSLLTFEGFFHSFMEENLDAGKESMWEIPFSSNRGRVMYAYAIPRAVETTGVTDKYTDILHGGNLLLNPAMFYEYEKEDVRRDVTGVPYSWVDNKQVLSALNRIYLGKYRYEWMKRRPTGSTTDGMNWIYMRYSDILLMAAEAINELDGGGPAAAAPYLEMVRKRAYPNNPEKVTAYMTQVTANQRAFFEAIVKERALEFAGEMLRKADLIRWNLLKEKLEESRNKLEQLSGRKGAYSNLPKKVYAKYLSDNETLEIYGMNIGDTDTYGAANYTINKSWSLSKTNDGVYNYWEVLYLRNPNDQQNWPIWQTFIDNSNGALKNF